MVGGGRGWVCVFVWGVGAVKGKRNREDLGWFSFWELCLFVLPLWKGFWCVR